MAEQGKELGNAVSGLFGGASEDSGGANNPNDLLKSTGCKSVADAVNLLNRLRQENAELKGKTKEYESYRKQTEDLKTELEIRSYNKALGVELDAAGWRDFGAKVKEKYGDEKFNQLQKAAAEGLPEAMTSFMNWYQQEHGSGTQNSQAQQGTQDTTTTQARMGVMQQPPLGDLEHATSAQGFRTLNEAKAFYSKEVGSGIPGAMDVYLSRAKNSPKEVRKELLGPE